MDGIMPLYKPLLTNEQFAKILEEDNDASIWLELQGATQIDPILNQVFQLSRRNGWSRFRTLMVCSYVMAQRHEHVMKLMMDQMSTTVKPLIFCSGCAKGLTIEMPEERKA